MLGDFVQGIDSEGSFADIAVDVEKGKEMEAYEATLEDIENTWLSWKSLGEIDLERARYLLSTDEMLEEMLGKAQG